MNNLILALLERWIAQFIERAFKNYVTTIAGVLAATSVAVAQYTSLVPPKYAPWLTVAGIVLAGVGGILAHDSPKLAQPAQK